MNQRRCDNRYAVGLVVLAAAALSLRGLAPSDIYDNDQPGPMSHIVDVAVNGQWLMQHDPAGRAATKPPMYPWLGAIAVKGTGRTDEWVFKLPQVAAFVVTGVLLFDLARRSLGAAAAAVAVAFWVANYHTFKLMYTARTDMLVTMWVVLALWAVQRQRDAWATNGPAADGPPRTHPGWILVFASAIGGGLLTKGPAALIPAAWLIGVVAVDRAWRACRPGWQVAGLILGLAIPLVWLVPAIDAHPAWTDNIRAEVFDRVAGVGTGATRDTPILAVPGYFVARFAPWSLLFVPAVVGWKRWQEAERRVPLWPAVWAVAVVAIFALPRGKRADYILPAYIGGAIVTAAFVARAAASAGWHRVVTHVVIGGAGIAGIGAAIVGGYDWIGGRATAWAVPASACVGVAAGVVTLMLVHRRRYLPCVMAAAYAVVGALGVYQGAWSHAAKSQDGEQVHRFVAQVRQISHDEQLPIDFAGTVLLPVQALLGHNQAEPRTVPADWDANSLLVVALARGDELPEAVLSAGAVVARTDRLDRTGLTLLLIKPVEKADQTEGFE